MQTYKISLRIRVNHDGRSKVIALSALSGYNNLDVQCDVSGKVFGYAFHIQETSNIGVAFLIQKVAKSIRKQTDCYATAW